MLAAAPAYVDKIDNAGVFWKFYPFLNEIDWISDFYAKLPAQKPVEPLARCL